MSNSHYEEKEKEESCSSHGCGGKLLNMCLYQDSRGYVDYQLHKQQHYHHLQIYICLKPFYLEIQFNDSL